VEWHSSLADQVNPAAIHVHAADRQATIGKRECEGQPNAAGSDDSYVWAAHRL
jgi:hypothetical protein